MGMKCRNFSIVKLYRVNTHDLHKFEKFIMKESGKMEPSIFQTLNCNCQSSFCHLVVFSICTTGNSTYIRFSFQFHPRFLQQTELSLHESNLARRIICKCINISLGRRIYSCFRLVAPLHSFHAFGFTKPQYTHRLCRGATILLSAVSLAAIIATIFAPFYVILFQL